MITLIFPAPAPFLNLNDRVHWALKARRTALWRTAACYAAVNAISGGLKRRQPRSMVQLVLPVKSLKVRRDPSNWYPTVKACIDGLVDARVFVDDSAEYVATVEPAFHLEPDVHIHITPIDTP